MSDCVQPYSFASVRSKNLVTASASSSFVAVNPFHCINASKTLFFAIIFFYRQNHHLHLQQVHLRHLCASISCLWLLDWEQGSQSKENFEGFQLWLRDPFNLSWNSTIWLIWPEVQDWNLESLLHQPCCLVIWTCFRFLFDHWRSMKDKRWLHFKGMKEVKRILSDANQGWTRSSLFLT